MKWQTGAGDEWSAPHAFGRGKLAMMIDGEWRVAFLAADHPTLQYGTAPMPVHSANKSLYGAGYVNGTIIGIPKGGDNRDDAWNLVKYLTTNDHALAMFSNGIRNVPVDPHARRSRRSSSPTRTSRCSRSCSRNPKSSTIPVTPLGSAHLETFTSFLAKWQAGKVKDLRAGLLDVDKQIDAKLKQSGGGRAVSSTAGQPGRAMPAPAAPAVDRRRARRRAGWRRRLTVLAFLSPWLVGFSVFFGYPLVMSALALAPQLRPAHPAALGRARELPLPARATTRRSGRRSRTRCG